MQSFMKDADEAWAALQVSNYCHFTELMQIVTIYLFHLFFPPLNPFLQFHHHTDGVKGEGVNEDQGGYSVGRGECYNNVKENEGR